jgi:hypothetical protein
MTGIEMEARAANSEGKGSVTLTDLVRQCLRMRPDRIVLGAIQISRESSTMTSLWSDGKLVSIAESRVVFPVPVPPVVLVCECRPDAASPSTIG